MVSKFGNFNNNFGDGLGLGSDLDFGSDLGLRSDLARGVARLPSKFH